jgi:hypothetical protein
MKRHEASDNLIKRHMSILQSVFEYATGRPTYTAPVQDWRFSPFLLNRTTGTVFWGCDAVWFDRHQYMPFGGSCVRVCLVKRSYRQQHLRPEHWYVFLCVIFRAFSFIIAIIFQHMHNFSPLYYLYLPTCFGLSRPSSGRHKLPKVID